MNPTSEALAFTPEVEIDAGPRRQTCERCLGMQRTRERACPCGRKQGREFRQTRRVERNGDTIVRFAYTARCLEPRLADG